MTQPTPPVLVVAVIDGEDGKKHPAFVGWCGPVKVQFTLPLDVNPDELGTTFATSIRMAYDQARLANSGLIVGQLDLTKINLNGKDSDA